MSLAVAIVLGMGIGWVLSSMNADPELANKPEWSSELLPVSWTLS
jgi:hypothetical protein